MTALRISYALTTGCSPIYQELLHSSSRYNATRTGEKNRPSNGLARISAHPRPPKKLKPAASGTRFTDWIGGICYADTLQVWFPARTSCSTRRMSTETAHPSWMDQEVAPVLGCSRSKVPLLGLSLEPRSYRSRCSFPMTCHWMSGTQGSTPCPLCGLMCLCWEPGWSAMIFHHIRKKYDVPSMWGNIRPQWRLLQQHLETKGPGWYPLAEREERLFTNRSNRPGDDMKDELRTDSDPTAWRIWSTSQNQLWQLRQPAPPLEFSW